MERDLRNFAAWSITTPMRRLAFLMMLFGALTGCGDTTPPSDTAADVDDDADDAANDTPDDTTEDTSEDTRGEPCLEYGGATSTGKLSDEAIDEVSGLAASRREPLLYVHNDGRRSRFYVIDKTGARVARIDLVDDAGEDLESRDCEDMADAPGPDGDYLYLADIGDNAARGSAGDPRADVRVHRMVEPAVLSGEMDVPGETFTFTYPDRPHDAEAMIVDPDTLDLYILTKENDGISILFVSRNPTPGTTTVLEQVRTVDFTTIGGPLVTGAAISRDGQRILVRTYRTVVHFQRPEGGSIADAFDHPAILRVGREPQGEAVCFAQNDRDYFTMSEGTFAPLYSYEWLCR